MSSLLNRFFMPWSMVCVFSTAHLFAEDEIKSEASKSDCGSAVENIGNRILLDPASTLIILDEEIKRHPDCASGLVRNAILTSGADDSLVEQIVLISVLAAEEKAAEIAEAAVLLLPDKSYLVKEAVAEAKSTIKQQEKRREAIAKKKQQQKEDAPAETEEAIAASEFKIETGEVVPDEKEMAMVEPASNPDSSVVVDEELDFSWEESCGPIESLWQRDMEDAPKSIKLDEQSAISGVVEFFGHANAEEQSGVYLVSPATPSDVSSVVEISEAMASAEPPVEKLESVSAGERPKPSPVKRIAPVKADEIASPRYATRSFMPVLRSVPMSPTNP